MSHHGNTQILEYWFDVGLSKGFDTDKSIAFAEYMLDNEHGTEPDFDWYNEVNKAR